MMRNSVQRFGEHVTAALLDRVTPRSAEVAIAADRVMRLIKRRRRPSPPVPSCTWRPARD
jgi:hypothetical protein